jgi:hypothetical protein
MTSFLLVFFFLILFSDTIVSFRLLMPKKLSLFKSTASYKTYFDKASVVLGNTAAPEILSQMAFNLLEIQKEKEKEFELLNLQKEKKR